MIKKIIGITLAICLLPLLAFADANITLEWDSNIESNMAYYNIYRSDDGQMSWNQINSEPIIHQGTGTETWIDINVSDGSYAWYVTAIDTSGLESNPSNIVTQTIDTQPPDPPQNFIIKLIEIIIAWLSDFIKHWFA